MTARTRYALPAPLTLTPSQLGRLGRFKVTNRSTATIRLELWTDDGADVVDLVSPGDAGSLDLLTVRVVTISASAYPSDILLESTELPIELAANIQIGNSAAGSGPVPVHAVGGGGLVAHLPAWNLTNPGHLGNPAYTRGVTAPPFGPGLAYDIWITDGLAGPTVASYLWHTVTGSSAAGDGTGLDNFGAQGPLTVKHGHTYYIWAMGWVADGNLCYSTGLTDLYDVSADWPAGFSTTQVPQSGFAAIPAGVPGVIGAFTVTIP